MNRLLLSTAGAAIVMAATIASGQAQPPAPSVEQYMVDPFTMPGSQPIEPERVPLFTIGNLPVQVWAPVEPAYDLHANRNLAANPTWGTTLSINPAPY